MTKQFTATDWKTLPHVFTFDIPATCNVM